MLAGCWPRQCQAVRSHRRERPGRMFSRRERQDRIEGKVEMGHSLAFSFGARRPHEFGNRELGTRFPPQSRPRRFHGLPQGMFRACWQRVGRPGKRGICVRVGGGCWKFGGFHRSPIKLGCWRVLVGGVGGGVGNVLKGYWRRTGTRQQPGLIPVTAKLFLTVEGDTVQPARRRAAVSGWHIR